MKAKRIAVIALLVFVVGSLAYSFGREFRGAGLSDPGTRKKENPPGAAGQRPDRVVVYYFRATARCPSCITIENYTREAVESGFSDALRDGRLQWQVVNVEEPGNGHFIRDYRLYAQSVVVVEIRDGRQTRWKNLDQVWNLLGDRAAFIGYVQKEVGAYLKGD
ncbi:MAG: nitrophenyl compound nitroreductase subunit ArsF family protein [Bacillota bacterium]